MTSSTGDSTSKFPSLPEGLGAPSPSSPKTKTSSSPRSDPISPKISPRTLMGKIITAKSEKSTPAESIQKMLQAPSSRNQFRGLSSQVAEHAKQLSSEGQKGLYAAIEERFRLVEHEDSNLAWIQRGDLLDAIDVLVEVSRGALKPMPAKASTKEQVVDETDVPLVPYKQMKTATAIAKTGQVATEATAENTTDMRAKLQGVTVLEHSKAAATVRVVSGRDFRFKNFMSKVYRSLTAALSKHQASRLFKSANDLASMSRGLEIGSAEYLTKKEGSSETADKQLVGYYRGPKFLFGRSVHQYRSRNDWFKRSLTPKASAEYLEGVEAKETKLTARYGALKTTSGDPISRVVVANSDSRVRYHTLEAGKFGEAQELTGKVLSVEAEEDAKARQDNAAYYAEKYKFTTKNLVGRENDDDMKISDPRAVIAFKVNKIDEKIRKKNEQIGKLESSKHPKKIARLQEKIQGLERRRESLKSSSELYVAAQHELLGGLWRIFDRQGATQVIQRLAPADVHNYVAPLNGRPLSHKEACEVLKTRMEQRLAALEGLASMEEQAELRAEIAHFDGLIHIFENQQTELGRASQATIDIYGTNESVSTPAISNKSSILAQNDRKVMMFLHEDDSFSMHVFIGATGVNKVDVDQQTARKMKQGARQGDMQFGDDRIAAKDGFGATTDTTTTDSHRKLRLGEWKGGFPINGSTVMSYYLPNDFSVLPKVAQYKKAVSSGEGADRAEIELKANMGDPLLIKTEVLYAQVAERCIGTPLTPESTLEGVKQEILTINLAERKPVTQDGKEERYFEHDQEVLKKIQHLLGKEKLTIDEQEMLKKFEATIESRITNLQQSGAIATANGVTVAQVELAADLIAIGVENGVDDVDAFTESEDRESSLADLVEMQEKSSQIIDGMTKDMQHWVELFVS